MEDSLADRGSVVRAARCLLGSVTRVLLLADIVVVKQLLLAKDKVARSLGRLESVSNFTEFVKAFSQFGAEMVELAHLTGDRQVCIFILFRSFFLLFVVLLSIFFFCTFNRYRSCLNSDDLPTFVIPPDHLQRRREIFL